MLAVCRRFAWLGFLAVSTGCAMCITGDDETYAAYGGAWERLDPFYGRVGSAFTPEVGMRVLPDDYAEPFVQPGQPAAPEELPQVAPQTETEKPKQPPETESGETESGESKSTDSSVLLGPIRTLR
jgi:hypothetical protein